MASFAALLTPWRLRTYPAVLAAAQLVAFVAFLALPARPGARVGGDFPAFYAAGRLVNAGSGGALYDDAAQAAAQLDLVGATGQHCHFAYPAFVAAAYAPLARLPYVPAYVLHTLASLALVLVAVYGLARRLSTALPSTALQMAAITFFPLSRAIYGGQNTALSLLCAAGAIAAGSDLACGAWLGLWLFKPQLAVPVIACVAVGRPRVLAGVVPVAAGLWALGAAVSGPGWVLAWLQDAAGFAQAAGVVDGRQGASLADGLAWLGGLAGFGVDPARQLAIVAALFAVSGLAWVTRGRPRLAIAVAVCLAPVLAPHALFYDAGVGVAGVLGVAGAVAAAAVGGAGGGRGGPAVGGAEAEGAMVPFVALLWAAGFLTALPAPFGVPLCVGAAALAWRMGQAAADPGPPGPGAPDRSWG